LGIGDWGLGIGDWGLGPIPQTQNPKAQTPIFFYKNIFKKKNKIYFFKKYKNKKFGGWVLGLGVGGLGPTPKSPIPNPQSPIPINIIEYIKF